MPAGLAAGGVVPVFLPALPPLWVTGILLAAGLACLGFRATRWLAALLLAASWSLWNYDLRLQDRLASEGATRPLTVDGTIISLPQDFGEFTRFRFRPDVSGAEQLPRTLRLSWYRERPPLEPGQRWRLETKLKPPWGSVNFQGRDRERWLFAEGIGAVGSVRSGHPLGRGAPFPGETLRNALRHAIAHGVPDERQRGIVQALAIADRAGMPEADSRLLRLTGTSHLLAISGLHIGLAAAGGFWLVRLLLALLPIARMGRIGHLLPAMGGAVAAISYSILAGLGIPTMRASLMAVAAIVAYTSRRRIHPARAWLLAVAAVVLIDPFAPLTAGFWFSFLAVATLLTVFVPARGSRRWWARMLHAQSAVMFVLLPVSAVWFGAFSPVGFLANLLAIPWVSLLVVPFVLAGVAVTAVSAEMAALLWQFAGRASVLLLDILEGIARWQESLMAISTPSPAHLAAAFLGAMLLLLPRAIPLRWFGVVLLLPLFLPQPHRPPEGVLELEVLDAGQGTAVLVSTSGHSLLYDTGPGDGRGHDFVAGTIVPALVRLGAEPPDRVVVSHADLDHAGGLHSMLSRYPGARYLVNHPGDPPRHGGCSAPLGWRWEGVEFTVLHPSAGLPYLRNESSCVISIRLGRAGLLLAGDVSAAVESRLLQRGLAPHTVVLVPHHGSSSSSSEPFVRGLQASAAVATASLGNRFGFPRDEVRQRYLHAGTQFWSTGECGALRLRLGADGSIAVHSARRERKRIWRWPATRDCP